MNVAYVFQKKIAGTPKIGENVARMGGKVVQTGFVSFFFHVCVPYARVARLWYALHVPYVTIVHVVPLNEILVPNQLFCLCLQSTL